jgi:hypothetical protein
MYVITYKNKPATLEKLNDKEWSLTGHVLDFGDVDNRSYIAAPTKKEAVEVFLYHFGFTWKERAHGIECQKAQVAA